MESDTVRSRRTKGSVNKFFKLIINKPRNAKNDLLSGLTVALALIPEAIAFSFVAGVDPKIGLYAAFMMGLICSIFGGRPGMISGATGAVAVIFAPLVIIQTKLVGATQALDYLFAAVILMGIIQIACGLFKFGKFIRLIPHPVMLGFVNGLAIIIFKAQFSQFQNADGSLLPSTELSIMLLLIVLTMGICHFLPKLTKALPATLVAIISVTLISILLNSNGIEVRTVLDYVQSNNPTKTSISASLPSFHIPQINFFSWETLKIIAPYAFIAAAVGLIESLMTLTLIDELTQTRGKTNKECVGQGFANLVNGFFGGMGGCAMIGQSMINIRGGGRGRTSGISAAIALLIFIVFLSGVIEVIPLAALVGVMFMVVIGTFEWSSIRIINKIPKSDALVIITVSVVTVLIDLAIAVFVGIIISALVFAWEHGKKINAEKVEKNKRKAYNLDGVLFFGSVSSFKELFDIQNDPEDVYINFEKARIADHSGIEAVNNIIMRYNQNNKKVHLLNMSSDCKTLLNKLPNIVETSYIDNLEWHIADDQLDG